MAKNKANKANRASIPRTVQPKPTRERVMVLTASQKRRFVWRDKP